MKKIKFTFPYSDWPLLRQVPGYKGDWGDYKFYINDSSCKECDVWVVFNFLNAEYEEAVCPLNNIILITGEPSSCEKYHPKYASQFKSLITSQRELRHKNKFYLPQGLPWFVSKSYDELCREEPIEKSKKLSIISSNKTLTDGHKKRLDFIYKLKDYFGDSIDLFGKGINEVSDKYDALSSYEYSIVIENSFVEDYFTEKLVDSYLTYTFPFYYGCPNVSKYFSEKSFLSIDINNFDSSRRIIENTFSQSSHYRDSLKYIVESRKKCLDCYNIFPLIVKFIESNLITSADRQLVVLKNLSCFTKNQITVNRLINKLHSYFQ